MRRKYFVTDSYLLLFIFIKKNKIILISFCLGSKTLQEFDSIEIFFIKFSFEMKELENFQFKKCSIVYEDKIVNNFIKIHLKYFIIKLFI